MCGMGLSLAEVGGLLAPLTTFAVATTIVTYIKDTTADLTG